MSTQPLEIIVNFDDVNTVFDPKPKISRTRSGCFNCRKRKKKCDETKPSCASCESKCIPCVWPKTGEKLPRNYSVPKPNRSLLQAKKQEKREKFNNPTEVKGFIHFAPSTETPVEFKQVTQNTPNTLTLIKFSNSEDYERDIIGTPYLREDSPIVEIPTRESTPENQCLDLEMMSSSASPLMDPWLRLFRSNIQDVLIVACVNGFIKSINTQDTHPQLTTTATFTPFLQSNKITEQVALSCGAAFLSWDRPEMKEISFRKYNESFTTLVEYMESPQFSVTKDLLWLAACFQLLCVCAKVQHGCTIESSVGNLKHSYKLIKMQLKAKGLLEQEKQYLNGKDPIRRSEFLSGCGGDLKMEIENSMIAATKQERAIVYKGLFDHNWDFEKMFLDSFIYNFCVSILFVKDVSQIPSPFVVFKELKPLLQSTLYSCEVSWMNNPIFGPSLNAFELAAKASYLTRNLNDPMSIKSAMALYELAKYLPRPIIPAEVRSSSSKYKSLRDAVLVTDCITSATKILLNKVINPDIETSDIIIQQEVQFIIGTISQVCEDSQCKVVSSWALFICGLACIEGKDREFVYRELEMISTITHAHYPFSVMRALEVSWGEYCVDDEDDQGFGYLNGKGLDLLFCPEFLSDMVV